MDAVRAQLSAWNDRWKGLALRTRILILAAVGVLAALGLLGYANSTQTEHAILFRNLDSSEAARVLDRLRALRVPYELEDQGTTILVPEAQVHEVRLTLAGEGLPSGGVGFELFDRQRFGESDFSEQVQFRRALEGELGRTLGHLVGVQSARVHLVLPQRSLFATAQREASASVALRLAPGFRLRPEQVQGVVHLVASSVSGLDPERVTVVDGDGQPLAGGGDAASRGAAGVDDRRAELERSRERAVQQLLDAALGPGNAMVRVTADMDLSHVEHVDETYDPERTATRSFEILEEGNGAAGPGGQGVPGAVSNLPGGPAAENGPNGGGPLSRRSERRNYEITKSVRRAVSNVGRVGRMTVAVVVDGRWTGEGQERTFVPRPEEELSRIRAIVGTAAGIDESRGDLLSVECVPFPGSASADTLADESAEGWWAELSRWLPWALAALLVLAGLIVALVLRRRREARRAALGRGVQQLEDPRSVAGLTAGDAGDEGDEEFEFGEPLADYESVRALALEVARRDPELAASVVRAWLAESSREGEEAKAA